MTEAINAGSKFWNSCCLCVCLSVISQLNHLTVDLGQAWIVGQSHWSRVNVKNHDHKSKVRHVSVNIRGTTKAIALQFWCKH